MQTMENILSHVGMGSKQISERYDYAPPVQDQHVYYAYEPSQHGHVPHGTSSKHNYGSGLKANASMSALTLLAFLFFLHILQQCLKEHMTDMNTSQLMVMTAGRESEEKIRNSANKLDKIGSTKTDITETITDANDGKSTFENYNARNPFQDEFTKKNVLTKIQTTQPQSDKSKGKYKYVYKQNTNHDQD